LDYSALILFAVFGLVSSVYANRLDGKNVPEMTYLVSGEM